MKKPKKLFEDPSMERCQNELVEYLRVLKYIGITQHGKLNDTLIDRFEKCVDWEAWSEKKGWPKKDDFHSMSNSKKMYLNPAGYIHLRNHYPNWSRLMVRNCTA